MIDRTFVQGSTSKPLVVRLEEFDGTPVDLRGATLVKFHVWPADRCGWESVTDAEVLDAKNGVVRHFLTDREAANPGLVLANISWLDTATPTPRPRVLPDGKYITVQFIPRGGRT